MNTSTSDETKIRRTRAELQTEINELKKKLPECEIRAPQIFFTDATPEATATTLAEQRGRAAMLSDEGNLFEIIAGIYTGGRQNLDVFLKGHSGC